MNALSQQDRVDSVDFQECHLTSLVGSWYGDLAEITGQAYTWSSCGLIDSVGDSRPETDSKQPCRMSHKNVDGPESFPLPSCVPRIAQGSGFASVSEQQVPLPDSHSVSRLVCPRLPIERRSNLSGCSDTVVIEEKTLSRVEDTGDDDFSAQGQSCINNMNLHKEGKQTWCAVRSHCNMSVWTASRCGREFESEKKGNYDLEDCPYFGFPSSINFGGMTDVEEFEPQVSCVGASHVDHALSHDCDFDFAGLSWCDYSWQQTSSLPRKKTKVVTFAPRVDVHIFCGNQGVHFGIDETIACHWLRNFWHLHGQNTTWQEMNAQVVRLAVDCTGGSDSSLLPAHSRCGQSSNSCRNSDTIALSDDAVVSNHQRWWDELTQVWAPTLARHSGKQVNTWFLSKGRLEVCLEARRIPVNHEQSFQDFLRDCRRTWRDWDDGSSLSFHVVHPRPLGLPSTIAHIIIVQGPWHEMNVVLYHGTLLPALRRQRAVMYQRGSTVKQFFSAAQHPEACQNTDFTCYLKVVTDGYEEFAMAEEILNVPIASCVEGNVRSFQQTHEQATEEDDGQSTNASTTTAGSVDTVGTDEFGLMSASPVRNHLALPEHEIWLQEDIEEFEAQVAEDGEVEAPIAFAAQHFEYFQEDLRHMSDADLGSEHAWYLATFGLGLIDLGRRDIPFDPANMQGLLDSILRVWSDHAAYGDLLVYDVHPQPIAELGPRTIALIVVVVMPEAQEPEHRCALIVEQAAIQNLARPVPYAAWLPRHSNEEEIMVRLDLHKHCPPFTLRTCHVRLGTVIMEQDQPYDFANGVLCRPWMGFVPEQVDEAVGRIVDVEKFFLQVQSWRRLKGNRRVISCHVHGVSPANKPLGHRSIAIETEWIYDLQWIDSMEQLWPFETQDIVLTFVPSAADDFNEVDEITFHFIVAYQPQGKIPILVCQQLIAVDEMQRDPSGVNERWAIGVPQVEVGTNIVNVMTGSPFWFSYARSQRVYPHMSVNGVKLIEVKHLWTTGDLLKARFIVWQRHHVLHMLMGAAHESEADDVEHTAFLQRREEFKQQKSSTDQSLSFDASTFTEICHHLICASEKAVIEDASVEAVVSQWTDQIESHCEGSKVLTDTCENPGRVDMVTNTKVQLEIEKALLRPRHEDNSDLMLEPSRNKQKNKKFCGHTSFTDDIANLRKHVQNLQSPTWKGLNTDFAVIPDLHPFARIASSQAPCCGGTGNVFHIFTDGSCRKGKAAWSFVVLFESMIGHQRVFIRVGYAADRLRDDIGSFTSTAHDAEATALIAVAEYLLSRHDLGALIVHLHFDAMAVGKGTCGVTKVIQQDMQTSNRQWAARILMQLVQCKAKGVSNFHVHAHRGHPWNEFVDSVAALARDGWNPPIQAELRSGALLNHALAEWAWLELNPTEELPDLEQILRNEKPDVFKGDFDRTLQVNENMADRKVKTACFKLATANVGTLEQDTGLVGSSITHKALEIMQQFDNEGIHVIALQETRARCSTTKRHGHFVCLVSEGNRGQGGVELWFNCKAIKDDFALDFDPEKDACAWHADNRILAVRCQFGTLSMEIVTCYAPQRGRGKEEIVAWWEHFRVIMQKADKEATLFVLGDMNCSVGSVESEAIGTVDWDFEDVGGEHFRETCDALQLFVPSTFEQFHSGASDTFKSCNGRTSRLDYIAVSKNCRDCISSSFVNREIDLLNGDFDHNALCLQLHVSCGPNMMPALQRRQLYDRKAAKGAKLAGASSFVEDAPSCPWSSDINTHWNEIREHVQEKATLAFPCQKRSQRQRYFSAQAWNLLCYRKDLRKEHRALQRERTFSILKKCFVAWKNPVRASDVSVSESNAHINRMQEALLLHMRMKVDRKFRSIKKSDWRNWVAQQLEEKIQKMRHAKASEIYQILKPKKMIAQRKGLNRRPLPGLKDQEGNWCSSRQQVAIAWDKQFSKIEHAEEIDFAELMQRSTAQSGAVEPEQLHGIPSLLDLERCIMELNDSKAPGLDGIGAEIWQCDTALTARKLFPIVLKAAIRKQHVVEWTGGWILPLYKGKGSPNLMSGYRAILLEPSIARAVSKSWRKYLVRGLDRISAPLQHGGRKGIGIEPLHLVLQLWQSNARMQRASLGIAFVDIQSAFYSIFKPLLAVYNGTTESIAAIFKEMKLPATAYLVAPP